MSEQPTSQPTDQPTEDLAVPPSKDAVTVRVVGTVSAGVEAGCLLLASGGTVYQLLGGVRPAVGDRVEVVGTLSKDVLTTCQQGIPLQVVSINPPPMDASGQ
jgi:hypothetical protein